ncbi:MAG: alpha-L-fucosidase [Prevotella sp.]|jgi:alpha-L-fucosidase
MKKLIISVISIMMAQGMSAQDFKVVVNTDKEPMQTGKFKPTLKGLSGYQCPQWFEDAKFGIWAHWGVQCAAEYGDWYARKMYEQGHRYYRYQIAMMGHPSEKGFKDWIPRWKAEHWNADSLVAFYKECGARYFMAMANHHDNFDNYDSKYQPWNSVNMGPHKDIIGGWAAAAKKYGLPFGVSLHLAHAWCWYETSRGSDSKGPLKGVRYDGWLTKADGKGTWWEGYDVQDLYEQRHPLSKNSRKWDWQIGEVTTPDQAYCDRVYNRSVDLINKYDPQIVYYDDTYVPLWPVSDCGLKITAHLYNKSMAEHGGKNMAVATGKILTPEMKQTIVWDVERGVPDSIQPLHWQTCTCIGSWHYDKFRYYDDTYKTPQQVITMLIDIVSKNGNLLLNVPVRSDGTIDPTEHRIVKEIGRWMRINGEAIYGTRPWVTFGEGPASEKRNGIKEQGFNEKNIKLTARDIRFTKKGNNLYVFTLGRPDTDIVVKSLASGGKLKGKIKKVEMLGSTENVKWKQDKGGLHIVSPVSVPCDEAVAFRVTTNKRL